MILTDIQQNTILIEKFKTEAQDFDAAGTLYTENIYGQHFYEYIEQQNTSFFNHKIKTNELNQYILFYCFFATHLFQQYKYHSSNEVLLDYTAYELTYNDIYKLIDLDIYDYLMV